MKRLARVVPVLVLAVLVASEASATPLAPAEVDVAVALVGAGSASQVPLAATVSVAIEGPDAVLLAIANTSPASSSTVPGAPVLTRLAFNLADQPPADCFALEAVDGRARFELAAAVKPFCGGGKARFGLGIVALNPAPKNGIAEGDSLLVRLRVDPACAPGFVFSPDAFVTAPTTPSGDGAAQWAAKFQVVGPRGADSGCAQGDGVPVVHALVYTWSEFIATAAEKVGRPSLFEADDTRAGSLEVNFNGAYGFDNPDRDAPYTAGIANLSNGAGVIVEQWQLNRRWPNDDRDERGCTLGSTAPQCWIFPPAEGEDPVQTVVLPTYSEGSNQWFDPSGERVSVSGEVEVAFDAQPFEDNGHELVRITWTAPLGIDTARIQLRLHYDGNLNGELGDEPFVPLVRYGWPGDGEDVLAPVVAVVTATDTELSIEVNVQDAMVYVRDTLAAARPNWQMTHF